MSTALDSFMQLKSIDENFIGASDEPCLVAEKDIKAIVNKMGFNAEDDNALLLHYQEEETRHWLSLLAPVCVFQQATSYELEVHLPIDFVTDQLLYRVTTEDGLEIDNLLTATDFPLLAVNDISDVEFQLYNVTLSIKLEFGYHQLALLEVGNEEPLAIMQLVITPDVCYQNTQIQKQHKIVGAHICLPDSKTNKSLKEILVESTQDSPLLNLKLDAQLQKLPEQWVPLFYLDVNDVIESHQYETTQCMHEVSSKLTNDSVIDTVKTKVILLRELFSQMIAGSQQGDTFSTFIDKGGIALKKQVSFAALHHHFLSEAGLSHCSDWPVSFQCYGSEGTQQWMLENEQEIMFWHYCYWIIEQQLTTLDEFIHAKGHSLGFYKQLVIGAKVNSFQLWANNEYYCQGIQIKAPLDDSTQYNENEIYSPLLPDQLYQSAYQPFIEFLQLNMRHSGALHIKHIVAFLRLWWVPENVSQEQGAFVYYNVYDLLNLLALESSRQQCIIVRDDSEPLPGGMEELLKEVNIYPLSLFDLK